MSLRRRIALSIIALLAVTSIAFACISLAVLDRTLRAQVDAKLMTFALAIGQIVDVHHGVLSVDAGDIVQIRNLHTADEHLAILDRDGKRIYGEMLPPSVERNAYRFARTTQLANTPSGLGTIVTWQSDRWIADVRRVSMLTFALVGLALIGVAALLSRALANAVLRSGRTDRRVGRANRSTRSLWTPRRARQR